MVKLNSKIVGWQLLETPIVFLITGISVYFTGWGIGMITLFVTTIIAHFVFGRK